MQSYLYLSMGFMFLQAFKDSFLGLSSGFEIKSMNRGSGRRPNDSRSEEMILMERRMIFMVRLMNRDDGE